MTPPDRGLFRANLTVASGTLVSRITGIIRVLVFGAIIGQTSLADLYDLANNSPNVVYELLLGGILAASLVPIFSGLLQQQDEEGISAIFSLAIMTLACLTGVAVLLSPFIFSVFSLSPDSSIDLELFRQTGTSLTRIFLVQMFFYGLTAITTAILNAKQKFFAAAWTPVLANIVTIASFLMIPLVAKTSPPLLSEVGSNPKLMWVLGLGSTLGIIVMSLGLCIALVHHQVNVRLRPNFRHPAIIKLLKLSVWAIGYVVANQVAVVIIKNLATPGSGNVDAYSKAFTIFQFPHGLLAVSIATTFGPSLARKAMAVDLAPFVDWFKTGLRWTAIVTVPASCGLFFLAEPIVSLLLQHGNFDHLATSNTSSALRGFAIGLAGFSIYLFVLRGFYAHNDTRTPFVINCFENLLNIVFAVALVNRFGVFGLGLSFALAYIISALVALVAIEKRFPSFGSVRFLVSLQPILASSAVMSVAVWLVRDLFGKPTGLQAAPQTVVAMVCGLVIYVAMLHMLKLEEVRGRLVRQGRHDG